MLWGWASIWERTCSAGEPTDIVPADYWTVRPRQPIDGDEHVRVEVATQVTVNELNLAVGQAEPEQAAGEADFLVRGDQGGALAVGQIVLCDRFTDSSEAYQGGGRKLGSKPVHDLHRTLVGDLQPDLTILMDSDVATSVDRARRRNRSHGKTNASNENRFERENRAFFTRVRATYLDIATREPGRVALVDARGTPDQTHAKILEIVRRKLHLLAAGSKS
jgi:hypothetical protein